MYVPASFAFSGLIEGIWFVKAECCSEIARVVVVYCSQVED